MGQSCGVGSSKPATLALDKPNKNVCDRTQNPLFIPSVNEQCLLTRATVSVSPTIPPTPRYPHTNSSNIDLVTSMSATSHYGVEMVVPRTKSDLVGSTTTQHIVEGDVPQGAIPPKEHASHKASVEVSHMRSPIPPLAPLEAFVPNTAPQRLPPSPSVLTSNSSHIATPMTATSANLAGTHSLPLFINETSADNNANQMPISIVVPVADGAANSALTTSSSNSKILAVLGKGLPTMRVIHAPRSTGGNSSGSPKVLNRDGSMSAATTTIENSTFSAEHSGAKLPQLSSLSQGRQKSDTEMAFSTPLAKDKISEVVKVNSTSDSSGMLALVSGGRKGAVDLGSSGVESTLLAYPSASMYMKAMGPVGSMSFQNGGSGFNVPSESSYSATVGSLPSVNNSVHVFSGDGHHPFKVRVTASVLTERKANSTLTSGELLSFDPYPIEADRDDQKQSGTGVERSQANLPEPSRDCFPSMQEIGRAHV